jgi:hypothetical protein
MFWASTGNSWQAGTFLGIWHVLDLVAGLIVLIILMYSIHFPQKFYYPQDD